MHNIKGVGQECPTHTGPVRKQESLLGQTASIP